MRIGIIGMGEFGRLYARLFSEKHEVWAYDFPIVRDRWSSDSSFSKLKWVEDGCEISRNCDVIFYAVNTESVAQCIEQFAPSTRSGAIVSGLTSVKTLEIEALERYLPKDCSIISQHPLFAPSVDSAGQKLALIFYRCSETEKSVFLNLMSTLQTDWVEIADYHLHDKISADTQAVTHFGFQCLGTAWKKEGVYPWENPVLTGGIDNVKVLLTTRIFAAKPHVYAGIAFLNPFSKKLIQQYAYAVNDLFKLMICEDEKSLRERVFQARDFIFGERIHSRPLLDDRVMGEYALGQPSGIPLPNSHLSLLAMADTWLQSNTNPYQHLFFRTPPFMLRLGIVEYLFKNEKLLEETIRHAALERSIRCNDLEFYAATREWNNIIQNKSMESYLRHFEEVRHFFNPERLDLAQKKSNELIVRLKEHLRK